MPNATGGNIIQASISGVVNRIHTFTSNSSLTFDVGGNVQMLVVGAGGGSVSGVTGGGGAGGVVFSNVTVSSSSILTISIGQGVSGANGQNSSVVGTGINVVAIGGGRGGSAGGGAGSAGGSGGGGGADAGAGGAAQQPASASGGFGAAGGTGGNFLTAARGGGSGPDGWNGRGFDIYGNGLVYFGGGGGAGRAYGQGGGETTTSLGGGGWGGGGSSPGSLPTAGVDGTGGGAGGQGGSGSSLSGGSGIVIIRYVLEGGTNNRGGIGISGNAAGGGGAGGYVTSGDGGGGGADGYSLFPGSAGRSGSGAGGGGASSATVAGGGGGIDLFGLSIPLVSGNGGTVANVGGQPGSPVSTLGIVGVGFQPGDSNGNGGLFGGGGGGVVGSVLDLSKGNGANGGMLIVWASSANIATPVFPQLAGGVSVGSGIGNDVAISTNVTNLEKVSIIEPVRNTVADHSTNYVAPGSISSPAQIENTRFLNTESKFSNGYLLQSRISWPVPLLEETQGNTAVPITNVSRITSLSNSSQIANFSETRILVHSNLELMIVNSDRNFVANANTAYNYQTIQPVTLTNDPRLAQLPVDYIVQGETGIIQFDPQNVYS